MTVQELKDKLGELPPDAMELQVMGLGKYPLDDVMLIRATDWIDPATDWDGKEHYEWVAIT